MFLRFLEPSTEELGRIGEVIAARHIQKNGGIVRARRLLTRFAEIDLLCETGERLFVVEVKTGKHGPRFRPGQRVTRRDIGRLRRAAAQLGRHTRVDLIEVLLDERGRFESIRHHRDLRRPIAS